MLPICVEKNGWMVKRWVVFAVQKPWTQSWKVQKILKTVPTNFCHKKSCGLRGGPDTSSGPLGLASLVTSPVACNIDAICSKKKKNKKNKNNAQHDQNLLEAPSIVGKKI